MLNACPVCHNMGVLVLMGIQFIQCCLFACNQKSRISDPHHSTHTIL